MNENCKRLWLFENNLLVMIKDLKSLCVSNYSYRKALS